MPEFTGKPAEPSLELKSIWPDGGKGGTVRKEFKTNWRQVRREGTGFTEPQWSYVVKNIGARTATGCLHWNGGYSKDVQPVQRVVRAGGRVAFVNVRSKLWAQYEPGHDDVKDTHFPIYTTTCGNPRCIAWEHAKYVRDVPLRAAL